MVFSNRQVARTSPLSLVENCRVATLGCPEGLHFLRPSNRCSTFAQARGHACIFIHFAFSPRYDCDLLASLQTYSSAGILYKGTHHSTNNVSTKRSCISMRTPRRLNRSRTSDQSHLIVSLWILFPKGLSELRPFYNCNSRYAS